MNELQADKSELEDVEISLLLEGLYRCYGFDFRDYSRASLKRRIMERMRAEKLETVSAFQNKVLHDAACLERLMLGLSVHATAMFRDPSFYLTFRKKVVPLLKTYPTFRSGWRDVRPARKSIHWQFCCGKSDFTKNRGSMRPTLARPFCAERETASFPSR